MSSQPRQKNVFDTWAPWGLFFATFFALFLTEVNVGFTRDESVYFAAAERHAHWYQTLVSHPSEALKREVIDAHFSFNAEHPALMKTFFGLSWLLFSEQLHWVRPATGFRLPAFAMAGMAVALIYVLSRRYLSQTAAVFAAVAFMLIPRHFFHAHLSCFDMPVTAMWIWVTLAYLRSLENKWAFIELGIAFGLAIATKHNAYFIPVVLGAFALFNKNQNTLSKQNVLAFGSMLIVSPILYFLHWPYLWHDTFARLSAYWAFHLKHEHYAWFYLGDLMRNPPFPLSYVVVKTALTVPTGLFFAMTMGFFWVGFRLFRPTYAKLNWEWLFILFNAIFSIALISLPNVPHFGGVKHWLPSMPYLCILAAFALERACALFEESSVLVKYTSFARHLSQQRVLAVVSVLLLISPLIATAHTYAFGTSSYSELAGSIPGAATLGMQRQYWSNNVTAVLPWLNAHAKPQARVYFHECHGGQIHDYMRNQMLRRDIIPVGNSSQAEIVLYQYHQEFREAEFEAWQQFGTNIPVYGFYLDETPQIVAYARPGAVQ